MSQLDLVLTLLYMLKCCNLNTTFGLGAGWPLEEIEMPSVVEPSDNDSEDDLKGILHKKKSIFGQISHFR